MLIPVLPQGVTGLHDPIHHLRGPIHHHRVPVRLPEVIVRQSVVQAVHHSAEVEAEEGAHPEVPVGPGHRAPLRAEGAVASNDKVGG